MGNIPGFACEAPNPKEAGVAMYRFFENEAFRNILITLVCLVLLAVTAPRLIHRPAADDAQSPVNQLEQRRALEQQVLDTLS